MLQYDFTETRLFVAPTREQLPTDAEMFAITTALLLVHEATYSDLAVAALELSDSNLSQIIRCIEGRLPEFVRDFARWDSIGARLEDFVGLRVSLLDPRPSPKST